MTPHFDRLVSIDVDGERFRVKAIAPDNSQFEFTMARDLASMMVATLLGAAHRLPPTDRHRAIANIEIELLAGADGTQALAVALAPNLKMLLQLRPDQLTYLRACIERIEKL